MEDFLTRLTARCRMVLSSFGEESEALFSELLNKINEVGGFGSKVLKEFPEIFKFSASESVNLSRLLEEAFYYAIKMKHSYVGTEHLLLASLSLLGYKDLPAVEAEVERSNSLPALMKSLKNQNKLVHIPTHAVDISAKYNIYSKEKIIKRPELERMFTILLQKQRPNVLLLGEPGSGKENLVEQFALSVAKMEVPRDFIGAYVLDFSFNNFMSSLPSTPLAFENAVKELAKEVPRIGNCVFVIKKMPSAVFMVALKQFIEYLNNLNVRFILLAEDESYVEELYDLVEVINVNEAPEDVIKSIMLTESKKLENHFLTVIPKEVVEYAYQKAKNEITEGVFPKKGLDLLDRACSLLSSEESRIPKELKKMMEVHYSLESSLQSSLSAKDYDKAYEITNELKQVKKSVRRFIRRTNIRLRKLTKQDIDRAVNHLLAYDNNSYNLGTKSLLDLEKRIKQKIIGQDKAVEVVAKALIRSQMGLRSKNRPVGNFLFLGPTGVGKTELAKVLAYEAFGEDSLIRLDMSDFSEKHTVARLVGAPPGYVGYSEGGELTLKIAKKPQSVVLFDEIEKAHPEVLNILLQIMEEGQLTDMKGETFNFSKAVIILTSNLGTEILHKKEIGYGENEKSQDQIEGRIMQSARSYIKPELLNRFDEIVIFRQLNKEDASKILELFLADIYKSLREKGVRYVASNEVKEYLLEKGFSKEFGARSLRRTVEKELLDKIAAHLLKINKGKEQGKTSLKISLDVKVGKGGLIVKSSKV